MGNRPMKCLKVIGLLLAVLSFGRPAFAHESHFYVDPNGGDDRASGHEQSPWRTLAHAMQQINRTGGTLHLAPDAVFREPLEILPATNAKPIVIEGHDALIDLGTDISAGPWIADGDGYRYAHPVPRQIGNAPWQMSQVYINGQPIHAFDPRRSKTPQPGELQHLPGDVLRVVFPDGLTPENARIILNADYRVSCVSIVGSNVTVRNLTARHAGNDGFNIHGDSQNIALEKVTALYCGDEGISAHGTSQTRVTDAIVAFNGSQAAGAGDVNDSQTLYKRCISFSNRGSGFYFGNGGQHELEDCIVANNLRPLGGPGRNACEVRNLIELDHLDDEVAVPPALAAVLERARALWRRHRTSTKPTTQSGNKSP